MTDNSSFLLGDRETIDFNISKIDFDISKENAL